MGGLLSCCCPCCKKGSYQHILGHDHDNTIEHDGNGTKDSRSKSKKRGGGKSKDKSTTVNSMVSLSSSSDDSVAYKRFSPMDFDVTLPVFAGIILDQKYSTYSYYDKKFIWVCPVTKTLHMSQFETKDRRHKEAHLIDILSIESVPPVKFKKGSPEDQDIHPNLDIYMSIKFQRGGGVDFRFRTVGEKNEFMNYLQVVTNMSKQCS